MCGIVYCFRKDGRPAARNVIKRYKAQKSRGTQGYGYVAVENNEVVRYERAATEKEIMAKLWEDKAPEILFHHRTPTSTPNVPEAAHPILVESPTLLDHAYFVAHNGVIRNADELYKQHTEQGFEYQTEMIEGLITRSGKKYFDKKKWNDTEGLAIETALAVDGKKTHIATEGSAAVVGLKVSGKTVVERFFYRNLGNPLFFYEDKVMISLTSQGQGDMVEPARLMKVGHRGGQQKVDPVIVTPAVYKSYAGGGKVYNDYADDDYPTGHTRRMGFQPRAPHKEERHISLLLPPKKEAKIILFEEDNYTDIPDLYSFPIETMDEDTLWSEEDRMIGLIKETKHLIMELDAVNITVGLNSDQYSEHADLMLKLDRYEKYEEELSQEITERMSIADGVQRATEDIHFES